MIWLFAFIPINKSPANASSLFRIASLAYNPPRVSLVGSSNRVSSSVVKLVCSAATSIIGRFSLYACLAMSAAF
ncbi:hypothetical protein SAMN05421760_10721 [Neptunomonas antarctica]|uniref:Uncharacterized protein n=1 Tax=Neptunomonas antarctica TaxID=619304 RepID=A0A1N7MUD6_9GAMM|nr:hypothetical protein SAMN05421760_10721 [Neptunomonas antarctica]